MGGGREKGGRERKDMATYGELVRRMAEKGMNRGVGGSRCSSSLPSTQETGRAKSYASLPPYLPTYLPPYLFLIQVFALFDDDGTGGISFRNLKRVATELGEHLTDEELQEMIGREEREGRG